MFSAFFASMVIRETSTDTMHRCDSSCSANFSIRLSFDRCASGANLQSETQTTSRSVFASVFLIMLTFLSIFFAFNLLFSARQWYCCPRCLWARACFFRCFCSLSSLLFFLSSEYHLTLSSFLHYTPFTIFFYAEHFVFYFWCCVSIVYCNEHNSSMSKPEPVYERAIFSSRLIQDFSLFADALRL